MNQDREARRSILYGSLNELLRRRMPGIGGRLEAAISARGYGDVIEAIECSLEKHSWGQDTQWRLDAEVDSGPCDESGRPFGIGGFVFLEEVAKRRILHFKTQLYNSFDETWVKQQTTQWTFDQINDPELVESVIRQTEEFLDQLYDKLAAGSDVFVREWRILKAEWDKDQP